MELNYGKMLRRRIYIFLHFLLKLGGIVNKSTMYPYVIPHFDLDTRQNQTEPTVFEHNWSFNIVHIIIDVKFWAALGALHENYPTNETPYPNRLLRKASQEKQVFPSSRQSETLHSTRRGVWDGQWKRPNFPATQRASNWKKSSGEKETSTCTEEDVIESSRQSDNFKGRMR